MRTSIPELFETRKMNDVALAVAIVVLGLLAFGLGRLSVEGQGHPAVALCVESETISHATATSPNVNVADQKKKQYVASKNGTAYYFPWCAGVNRIKEQNRVWFATVEQAEAAGYRAASNCKGL